LRSKNVEKSKGIMSTLFIPLLLFNMIFTGNYEYAFITRIICLAISILIFIMSNINIKNRDLGIIKNIGVGYLYICILRFIDLENIWITGSVSTSIRFIHVIAYFELSNILTSIIFYNKKKKITWQHLIHLINIMFIYLFVNYNDLVFGSLDKNVIFFSLLVCTIVFFTILYLYMKLKLNYNGILIFTSLIYSSVLLSFLESWMNKDFFINGMFLKLVAYFFLYEEIENKVLSVAYLNACKNLKYVKDKKIILNKRLNLRNNELTDLNTLIEKSEQNYNKIITALSTYIIVFENNRKTYSNIEDEIFGEEDRIKDPFIQFNGDSLKDNIKRYCDIEYNDYIKDFVLVKDFRLNNGENRKLEIKLVTIYENKRILFLNDITKTIEHREELINLELDIKVENLKEEFHSNISHELRTPINVIYSALQLKDLLIKEEKYDRIIDNNNVIRQNCLRLIRTIDNFIDSNKLSDNKLEFNKKLYNLVEIIDNIVVATNRYMENKNIELTFEPEYEEVYFLCDKRYIERIMLNILSNSVKYGKRNSKINIILEVKNKKIKILVRNDNDAIPLNKQKEVFEKFTKINNSLNRPTEGSGLGLFLTKGLVEIHNGEILLESKENVGNTFIITLPYDFKVYDITTTLNKDFEINDLKKSVDIEFSDIYF